MTDTSSRLFRKGVLLSDQGYDLYLSDNKLDVKFE